VPAKIYNDLAVQFDLREKYQVGIGVENLFDVMPTYMPTIYQDNRVYGIVGRYFYGTFRATF
jgi:hypothetical protein